MERQVCSYPLLLTLIVYWSEPPTHSQVSNATPSIFLALFCATLFQSSLSSVCLLPFGGGRKKTRISVKNKTGPPKASIMRRRGRKMGLREREREIQLEKRGMGGGQRKLRKGYKWRKTVLKVQVCFFAPPFLLLFLPHKTMEMQMLLISTTSERTCSD